MTLERVEAGRGKFTVSGRRVEGETVEGGNERRGRGRTDMTPGEL